MDVQPAIDREDPILTSKRIFAGATERSESDMRGGKFFSRPDLKIMDGMKLTISSSNDGGQRVQSSAREEVRGDGSRVINDEGF